jgi:acyl carrier protein
MHSFAELQAVLAEFLDVPPDQITRESVAKDFKGWDSIAHAKIILAVEEAFDIEFGDEEIFTFRNVGAIHDSIQAKKPA